MMMLHYRFPDMFLRVSKKAFVSIITDILEIGCATPVNIRYSAIRKRLKGLNIRCICTIVANSLQLIFVIKE